MVHVLYIDGGARGNPGPAGAGALIYDERGNQIAAEAFPLGILTNNAAEYAALIKGLEMARDAGVRRLEVRTDSQLLVRQIQGIYRTRAVHLREAALTAHKLIKAFSEVRFISIPREQNREADRLANRAMDSLQAGPESGRKN